jgi:aldehyde dehydrogenase (NAD+)
MGASEEFAVSAQAGIGLNHLQTILKELKEYQFEEKVGSAVLFREPIGVCGLITPWNWPMNQITLKVGACLAVGATCILKPSEFTPTSAVIFGEILEKAQVPNGVFNLVHGTGPVVGVALVRIVAYVFVSV